MSSALILSPKAAYASLYLHFPFCESKCHYCDFYSLGREKTKDGDAPLFERALIKEIEMRGENGEFAPEIKTIFLGGGTPSMTPPASMERIFNTLFRYTKLATDIEWTMEANPSSIALEQFRAYRSFGINRVSMGVQSLNNEHLKKLGRVHDTDAAFRALDTLFAAGFTNVSTDLLCGVPGQTVDDLQSHMEKLSAYPIKHLSIYLLTLAPHHAMYQELPQEDEQLAHLLFIDEFMRNRGFEHYEISNFAQPGFQAKHNLVYWKGGAYLGFGPSAHSFAKPSLPSNSAPRNSAARFKNFSSLHRYAKSLLEEQKLPVEWTETLNPEQQELEKWMLAFRLAEGFPQSWLQTDRQKQKSVMLLNNGLLEPHPEHPAFLRATPRGFALSDSIIKELT
jgi:oxygen-independent coproporphyrinogen-3 oxidase